MPKLGMQQAQTPYNNLQIEVCIHFPCFTYTCGWWSFYQVQFEWLFWSSYTLHLNTVVTFYYLIQGNIHLQVGIGELGNTNLLALRNIVGWWSHGLFLASFITIAQQMKAGPRNGLWQSWKCMTHGLWSSKGQCWFCKTTNDWQGVGLGNVSLHEGVRSSVTAFAVSICLWVWPRSMWCSVLQFWPYQPTAQAHHPFALIIGAPYFHMDGFRHP